jgi:hypothetical protein
VGSTTIGFLLGTLFLGKSTCQSIKGGSMVTTTEIMICPIIKGFDFDHDGECFIMEDEGNGFKPLIVDGKIVTFGSHDQAKKWLLG